MYAGYGGACFLGILFWGLGIFGAWKENENLLCGFIVCIGILMAVVILYGIGVIVYIYVVVKGARDTAGSNDAYAYARRYSSHMDDAMDNILNAMVSFFTFLRRIEHKKFFFR